MIDVTVPPGAGQVDLVAAGLVFERGDALTISSPPYMDKVLRQQRNDSGRRALHAQAEHPHPR